MRVTTVLWIATLVGASPLAAQDASTTERWPIAEGSRVRVRSPILGDWGAFRGARYATGSVVSATGDTLTFRADGDSSVTAILPVRRIFMLEIARGTHDNKKQGALMGALAGLVAGTTIAALSRRSCRDIGGCPDGYYREADLNTGALLGALGGALIGAWMGRRPVDTWVPVALPER